MVADWPRFFLGSPGIAVHQLAINGALFQDTNRGNHLSHPDIGLEMAPTNRSSASAIMAQMDGRPEWWWVGHDFARISLESRTANWQLTGSSFWNLIAAIDASIFGPFSPPRKWIWYSYGNRLSSSAIRAKKPGGPERRQAGDGFPQDRPGIAGHSMAINGDVFLGPNRG